MIINHNLNAMNAHRNMLSNTNAAGRSMEKLSSGLRINKAGDDAAGLAISEKMRGQIRGLDQASRNANDGISMIQTAEGALNETQSILQRMRELSVQAANDTNVAVDREAIQEEVNQLTEELDRIANTTEFNTKKLLNGSMGLSTSDSTSVSKMDMTADTVNGTYTVNTNGGAITLGTAASTGNIATQANGLVKAAGTLTINGVDFTTTATTTLEDLANDITNKVSGVTATYDNVANTFKIETDSEGSSQTLDITASADGIINGEAYKTTALAATGTNLTGLQIDGSAADFTADGNKVTINSGNAKGLSFIVDKNNTTGGTDITVGDAASLHIGANKDQTMSIAINAMDAANLGVNSLDLTTTSGAEKAIETINDAISSVSSERAKIGAFQNRLEHTMNNLNTSSENLTASESRIRDVDMAKEMMAYSKKDILNQAAQAMLAKANQQPQAVLQLLR